MRVKNFLEKTGTFLTEALKFGESNSERFYILFCDLIRENEAKNAFFKKGSEHEKFRRIQVLENN